jgi:hypothetical protein
MPRSEVSNVSMRVSTIVSVRGKLHRVAATEVAGRIIVIDGSWLKIARVQDDEVAENAAIEAPPSFARLLKQSEIRADLFAFRQKLTDPIPRLQLPFVWENLAVIPITTYSDWWNKRLSQDARRNVRLAQKRGVRVETARFNEDFVKGIKGIYDEIPVRQGRPFWHYGKTLEAVRDENGTYLNRSEFLGAYCNGEMIGFIKLIYVDGAASISQILAKNGCYDKRPANALIAKAVEICEQRKSSHLIYCQYTYGKGNNSSLTEFKRRSGFEKLCVPRYYIPLTERGRLAMRLNLHRGIREMLPKALVAPLLTLRARYHALRTAKSQALTIS